MTHYEDQRWVATPSPEVTAAVLARASDAAFLARLEAKIDTRNADRDECDIWTGALSSEGYGIIRVGRHVVRAHRVKYIVTLGAPPDDTPFLDHFFSTCLYRFCVNEHHLQPVDNAENLRRGRGIGSSNQRAMRFEALAARDEWEALRFAA